MRRPRTKVSLPAIIPEIQPLRVEKKMKIAKLKQKATVYENGGRKIEVNFHLQQIAEKRSGRETILDLLNSETSFIPLEDLKTGEIFFLNKSEVVRVGLYEREAVQEIKIPSEVLVDVRLTDGDFLVGTFLIDMPPARSRVSDYLNYSPQFIYLCQKEKDSILNKAYVRYVKNH